MATLIPSYEKVLTMKVKPEEGELYLLKFLDKELDSSFEVYFNPYMNGDRPDIVIMRKGFGVMVIEVKDYNLDLYELDDRKNFVIKSNKAKTYKSPISQVLKYKDNLYELHIDKLLEKKIKDIRNFNIVSSAVYFHKANSEQIKEMLVTPFEKNRKYQDFLKYNIDLIGRDNLNELDFNKILKKRYLKADKTSFLFTDDIYNSFKRFLKPTKHLKEEGKEIPYSKKQMEIIYDSTRKEQRIKGVVGSGKTTILAARAVQAHKRTNGNVLILTYNITLRNYIKDKISDVREDFPWENFVISNYHLFISSQLNNLGIPVEVPKNFNELSNEDRDAFFENKYYSNKKLFIDRKDDIIPYDVILIDEIQDYKRAWMEIIKECFLSKNGEYVLFGDVKQNIYNNTTDGKDVSTNVRGVTELKNCFRSDFKIKDLAILFQQYIFQDKYEIDSFNKKPNNLELEFIRNQHGSINYIYLQDADSISSLYTIIYQNALNKDIPPNDITVLGNSISLLKKFDAYYRYSSNERTNTMFETNEMVYRMGLNYLKNKKPLWLVEGIQIMKRHNDRSEAKAFNQLSVLFTINDLFVEYPDRFRTKLEIYSRKYSTTIEQFLNYIKKYSDDFSEFKKGLRLKSQSNRLKMIRNNKKLHFYFNSGTVKLSTIHSFKGWESEMIFLILENFNFQLTFDEILYTGITRSRANLIIINYGNKDYNDKLKKLVEQVK